MTSQKLNKIDFSIKSNYIKPEIWPKNVFSTLSDNITCVKSNKIEDYIDILPSGIYPFSDLKTTTTTLVIDLACKVEKDTAFYLLPITPINVVKKKSKSKSKKLPHCDVPGSILCARYKNVTRGAITNGYFRNSILIDMSLKNDKKNVSIKLATERIQFCGARSKEETIEGVNYILNHLYNLEQEIYHIQSEEAKPSVEWIKNNLKKGSVVNYTVLLGKQKIKKPIENSGIGAEVSYDTEIRYIYTRKDDYKLIFPTADEIPDWVDPVVTRFYHRYHKEYKYYNNFLKFIRITQEIKRIYTGELKINGIYQIMSNRHYKVGFYLDRKKLRKYINEYSKIHNVDFYAEFDSSDDNKVRVSISISSDDHPNNHLTKPPTNSFIISKEGYVTQSGYGDFTMTITYYLFLLMIRDIRHLITKTPKRLLTKHQQQPARVSTSVLALVNDDNMSFDEFVQACKWKPPTYGMSNDIDAEFANICKTKKSKNKLKNEVDNFSNIIPGNTANNHLLSLEKRGNDDENDDGNDDENDDGNDDENDDGNEGDGNEGIDINMLNDITY